MILKAYCLLDMKAGAFATPFFMHHDAQAVRAVTELGQDTNTTVGRYPADFALCMVGTFDDASGVLTSLPVVNLGTVAGFLPSRPTLPLFQTLDRSQGPAVGVNVEGETV